METITLFLTPEFDTIRDEMGYDVSVSRQMNVAALMGKKRDIQFFFHAADCSGQRRLSDMESFGSFCQMFQFSHFLKIHKRGKVYFHLEPRMILDLPVLRPENRSQSGSISKYRANQKNRYRLE